MSSILTVLIYCYELSSLYIKLSIFYYNVLILITISRLTKTNHIHVSRGEHMGEIGR